MQGKIRLRVAYTYKKAIKAVFVTTCTTFVAFMANLISNIIPIQAFGVYAAILILVNFLIVSLFFMPMLTFYEANIRRSKCIEEPRRVNDRPTSADLSLSFERSRYARTKTRVFDDFFGTHWNMFVKYFRWLIILIFLAWGGLAVYRAKDI